MINEAHSLGSLRPKFGVTKAKICGPVGGTWIGVNEPQV